MKAAKQKQASLVDLLAKVSVADLADIDQQIAAKQAELDEANKRIGGELDALKTIRKVIDIKLNGKPARKKREPKAAKAEPVNRLPSANGNGHDGTSPVERIRQVLKDCGPCLPATIAKKLGGEHLLHSVSITLGKNKDKFMREDNGTWDIIE